jgi:transitional endoplasmic reticulum ATPase
VELLILLFGVMLLLTVASRMVSRRRERHEEEHRRRTEALGRRDPDEPTLDPFAGFPLGGLFGDLLTGGTWSKQYEYDPERGWVEVGSAQPEVGPASAPPGDERPGDARSRKRQARRARSTQSAGGFNPLEMLGGGGMGGLGGGDFEVEPPDELTTFDDVGGMEELKAEIRNTIGLLLEHPERAEEYGIEWNGILLHGLPGVGKTFVARAIAGQYRLNLIHVSTGDLIAGIVGQSARNVDKAFQTALDNLPCLLLFDEFDSVAQRRDNTDQESRRTVNQLLTALEAHRDEKGLVVMAATNSIEHLDPAVIRPGRFDRHIRIDLPDADARRAIFSEELEDRPVASELDVEELVRRTEGMTPAGIEKVVEIAALDVFRRATETGERVELEAEHLLAALERYGGQDRPTIEHWTWASLVLPQELKAQLQQLQAIVEDPESVRRFGVEPPTGLLLAGPPGTGKTTVAKVLAAQARASFYPVSGADVMSKWVGESERNIRQLFERARDNRPSIIFIDEIDAIAPRRGDIAVHDAQVNQLLAEIDGVGGQRGVFVIGATNRPDQLDPALLRGGRLSRTIVLGLPDEGGRLAILKLHTARMPTVGVRLDEIARATAGFSPADLKALAQEAALTAMTRADDGSSPAVMHADFEEAVSRLGDRTRKPATLY